jgi:uncharacterized protein (TIGR00299 family) protein
MNATRAVVGAPEGPPHRVAGEIQQLIGHAALPARVEQRARRVFRLLADVEGAIHSVAPDEVELHEVGALDAIVDVVGTCAALEVLDVDVVFASPVAVGLGTIRGAHGLLPNPAPATLAVLARSGAPTYGVDIALELATPTGAALLAALATSWGPLPPMVPSAIGYGAGSRDLPGRPNVVQVVVGSTTTVVEGFATPGQPVTALEANVDDATGEVLAHTIAALLDAGAHDAWVTPIVMKKGRPAHTVHALCDPVLQTRLAAILVRESGSLGVRATRLERWPQARREVQVYIDGHPVRVKVGASRLKAEHDDAAALARSTGRSLREALRAAEEAARAVVDGAEQPLEPPSEH